MSTKLTNMDAPTKLGARQSAELIAAMVPYGTELVRWPVSVLEELNENSSEGTVVRALVPVEDRNTGKSRVKNTLPQGKVSLPQSKIGGDDESLIHQELPTAATESWINDCPDDEVIWDWSKSEPVATLVEPELVWNSDTKSYDFDRWNIIGKAYDWNPATLGELDDTVDVVYWVSEAGVEHYEVVPKGSRSEPKPTWDNVEDIVSRPDPVEDLIFDDIWQHLEKMLRDWSPVQPDRLDLWLSDCALAICEADDRQLSLVSLVNEMTNEQYPFPSKGKWARKFSILAFRRRATSHLADDPSSRKDRGKDKPTMVCLDWEDWEQFSAVSEADDLNSFAVQQEAVSRTIARLESLASSGDPAECRVGEVLDVLRKHPGVQPSKLYELSRLSKAGWYKALQELDTRFYLAGNIVAAQS